MRKIYIDESGNTGADLLDHKQPVFTLASNNYTDYEAAELIAIVKTPQAKEAKFASLKKSAKGRSRLIDLFKHDLVNVQRAKTTSYHKQYMALTKVIDVLAESVAHETGFDIYENGMNIAMANMHFYCLPTFCGIDKFEKFLAAFICMMRTQTKNSIDAFYSSLNEMIKGCSDPSYAETLTPIEASKIIIEKILRENNYLALDPAIPALFNHCSTWGEETREEFIVIHDTSKPIKAQIDIFNGLMNKKFPFIELGYDTRKFTLPLRSKEIQFGDSKLHPQLQLSDLIASATSYMVNCISQNKKDEFSTLLRNSGIELLIINAVWPQLTIDRD